MALNLSTDKKKLSKIFWGAGVLFPLFVFHDKFSNFSLLQFIYQCLKTNDVNLLLIVMLLWFLYIPLAIWKCAPNTTHKAFTYLARLSVVLYIILNIYVLIVTPESA